MSGNSWLESIPIDRWPLAALLQPAGQLVALGCLAIYGVLFYLAVRGLRSIYAVEGRRFSRCRLTGREVAVKLLQHIGLASLAVEDGATIDNYDMWRKRVRLRTESSVAASVAALAIAAHEVGHAEQFHAGYWAARATRGLLVALAVGGAALFVYPFAAVAWGAGDVNLTSLVAPLVIVALVRLPISMALEGDATRRAKRLLEETNLVDASERAGIGDLMSAAYRTHLAAGVGLVLLVAGCLGTMWLVETGLEVSLPAELQVAVLGDADRMTPGPTTVPNSPVDSVPVDGTVYFVVMFAFSLFLAWWAIRGGGKQASARSAVAKNNDGMARFLAGDVEGALAHIDEALRLDPGLASAHYNRAVVLCGQGRSQESLASIEAMLACRPEEVAPFLAIADPWYLRGIVRLDCGDFEGAIADLTKAYDLGPAEQATLLRNRGLAWIRLGRLEEALADTNAALALAPEDAVAYNNRGVIQRDLGEVELARQDLERALAIDPTLPNPKEHLAKLLAAEPTAGH